MGEPKVRREEDSHTGERLRDNSAEGDAIHRWMVANPTEGAKEQSQACIELVKAAQWKTWHRGKDLWLAAGEAVQRCQYRP